MITAHFIISYLSVAFLVSNAESYKILGIFTHIGKSHYVFSEALMKGLAAKGHEVHVVSHFPQKEPVPNFIDISLEGSMKTAVEDTPLENVGTGNVMFSINMLANLAVETCEKTLSSPAMQNLIKYEERYDLIVTELFNTDCTLGFVHKFKAPFIAIATSFLMPWGNSRFGNPDNPSYIPHHFLPHSDRMSFGERFRNAMYHWNIKWAYNIYMNDPTEAIAKKYFGESLPPLADIARNTSLLLLNTHFSINQPRPFVPNIIEVGGLHLTPPKELPKDLKQFMDEAVHGVIYFSLGSLVKSDTLPADKRDAFIQAFSELPQRVLWKWESNSMPKKPANVKLVRWMPQVDVLRHANVKVFITHGGLMGSIEAVHSGVPLVGIPLFGDQEVNVASFISEGFAVKLPFTNISKESVLHAVKTVLYTPSYSENALRISKAFNDRPLPALDTAIYWTEYVIRHRGAPHLRSAALDLQWYQYLLLDVIAVLVSVALAFLFIVYYLIKIGIGTLKSLASVHKRKRD